MAKKKQDEQTTLELEAKLQDSTPRVGGFSRRFPEAFI
jgi:hypothetical protein